MTSVILHAGYLCLKVKPGIRSRKGIWSITSYMSNSKPNEAAGTDWTRLLADPDLARNLGKLLQTYRDASPENREQALLAAMREIKREASKSSAVATPANIASEPPPSVAVPATAIPPFEPDIFSPNWDRIDGAIPELNVL